MDDQNQKPEPQPSITPQPDSPSPSIGGQKVIQPTPGFDPSKSTPEAAPSVVPTVATPSQPPAQYPAPSIGLSGTELAHAEQAKRGRKRMIKLGVTLVVLIVIGVAGYAFRTPLIALLPSKYATYTYPRFKNAEPFKVTVDYYKNSNIVNWAPAPPPGYPQGTTGPVLMSPVQQGISAMALKLIVGPLNSAGQAAVDNTNACNQTAESEGSTIYIPSLQATADMCQVTAQVNGKPFITGYLSGVASPATNSIYLIELTSNYSYQTSPAGITHALNFQDYQSEVQHIISSIKYVKQ